MAAYSVRRTFHHHLWGAGFLRSDRPCMMSMVKNQFPFGASNRTHAQTQPPPPA